MNRPTIGITIDTSESKTSYESPMAYAAAVEKAGGLPLLLPYKADLSLIPQYVDLIAGMLFTGGHDLDARGWGEENHPRIVPVDPAREKFERALMAEVEKRRTPTLGICFGSQLMNVTRGGTMIQFLPEHDRENALEHRRVEKGVETRHPVLLESEASVAKLLGKKEVFANSSHKQSVGKIGRGLRIIAKSPDGIIEGVEDPTMPLWLGLQWHPERLVGEPDHERFFALLVEKAAKN
ncbi:MAG TPA: gamma-glutamyl-gamma-aminobutyrate hydrolase family protein [Tepidisphaeraceae bacterium]|jgi:putative glutamine amidotransferase